MLTDAGCSHPGPTLRALELLQQERFRQDIISPEVAGRLYEEGMRAAVEWHQEKDIDAAAGMGASASSGNNADVTTASAAAGATASAGAGTTGAA